MKILVLSGIVFALSGCATAHRTVMPDGRQGLAISCSGSANSWAECYEKAGESCPGGYDIVSKDGDSGNAVAGGSGTFFAAGAANSRSMMVSCK